MNSISGERFEELVAEALESIPQGLWDAIENVAVLVEDWPSRDQMASVGLQHGNSLLLGLYQGVPLTVRSSHYGLVPPDKISIFRIPILTRLPAGR